MSELQQLLSSMKVFLSFGVFFFFRSALLELKSVIQSAHISLPGTSTVDQQYWSQGLLLQFFLYSHIRILNSVWLIEDSLCAVGSMWFCDKNMSYFELLLRFCSTVLSFLRWAIWFIVKKCSLFALSTFSCVHMSLFSFLSSLFFCAHPNTVGWNQPWIGSVTHNTHANK